MKFKDNDPDDNQTKPNQEFTDDWIRTESSVASSDRENPPHERNDDLEINEDQVSKDQEGAITRNEDRIEDTPEKEE